MVWRQFLCFFYKFWFTVSLFCMTKVIKMTMLLLKKKEYDINNFVFCNNYRGEPLTVAPLVWFNNKIKKIEQ